MPNSDMSIVSLALELGLSLEGVLLQVGMSRDITAHKQLKAELQYALLPISMSFE